MRLSAGFLCGASLALCLGLASPMPIAARTVTISVDEGTKFAARRLPDGRLLIDLQGAIWSVPAGGGTARRITTDDHDFSEPDIAPDGRTVAMQGYTGRGFRLFLMQADGKELREIGEGGGEQRQPRWSPDGRLLAYVSTRDRERPEIWLRDTASGAERQLTQGATYSAKSSIAWRPDGQALSFVDGGRIRTVAITDGRDVELGAIKAAGPSALSWSPDGHRLAFVTDEGLWAREAGGDPRRIGTLDDVFPFAPTWLGADELLYTANGHIQRSRLNGATSIVPFRASFALDRDDYRRKTYDFTPGVARPAKGIVAPALSPDGKTLVYRALGALWLQPIDGAARRITGEDAWVNDPAWSPDGRSIAYTSDTQDGSQLYVYDLATGKHERLTSGAGTLARPFWSPDGDEIAYIGAEGDSDAYRGREAIWAVDRASRQVHKIASAPRSGGRASWSPDGRTIVYAATDAAPFAGGRSGYIALDATTGAHRYHAVAPERSISSRADNGPVWSPDGRALLFVMESRLWKLAVAPDGTPAGEPVLVADEVADAPSWSQGGIAYLSNTRLRLLDPATAKARTIETGLSWSRAASSARTLIHAGALWDGRQAGLRRDVDILIEGSRILSVTPHDAKAHASGAKLVDASGLTVAPGLVDGHIHVGPTGLDMGRNIGPLYLSFGITTTRATGDIAYRSLEDREARDAGVRIAPRLFWAGEMIEGTRHSNDRTHPVETEAQLAIEVERIKALDYDLVKVYRFFPSDWQKRLIATVHKQVGIPLTSHYLFPNVAHGMDQLEHVGGPTRWGMDDNHVRSHGNIYADVFQAIARSGIFVTTTNFASSALLADDPALTTDPRIALFGPADRKTIVAELACAQGKGPCGSFLQPDAAQSARNAGVLARLAKAGANIVAGTDSPWDSPAVSLHLNLRSLQKAGLTPFEVLQTATVRPAEMLNVAKDLGTVEPGKLADLIVVRGDPSQDVRHLADVEMVMTNGRLFRPQELIGQ